MRFLDLDLDFFLNESAYYSAGKSGRLSSQYKPWSAIKVRHFLEEQCGLSCDNPIPGRTVLNHDEVFYLWRTLIESWSLYIPFEVIHIDAHPDLCVEDGMYLRSEILYVEPEPVLAMLRKKQLHAGNYLTFAIGYGWIASLVWVSLSNPSKRMSGRDGITRPGMTSSEESKGTCTQRELPALKNGSSIPFKTIPWRKFRTRETFNFIALCRSPDFTPSESDELVPVIEDYIKQI
jgi:hypothetical protein